MDQKVFVKNSGLRDTVGRSAKWSLLQTIVSALTVFILYKFLYGSLGAEQLGLWAVIVASVSVGKLAELGFTTTVLRYVSQYVSLNEEKKAADVLETALVSISVPLALILLLVYPLIEDAVFLVLPKTSYSGAHEILPFALVGLWVGIAGSIVQSAVDGCGRMDLKCKVLIAANLVYVPVAVFLTNLNGVSGLAVAQLIQSAFVLFFCWLILKNRFPSLSIVPSRWVKSSFLDVYKYAAGLQVGNLLLMLAEPATKILISRSCGLVEVAHFEMANQVVSRVRGLLVSGMQAYLPVLSTSGKGAKEEKISLVQEAFSFASGFGVPLMAFLFICFPMIGNLWIGHREDGFILYGWILSVGWLFATLAMPTYFYCVGAGYIKTILLSQSARVAINISLGCLAAYYENGYLVAFAMTFSLVVENFITARRAINDMNFSLNGFLGSKVTSAVFLTLLVMSQSAFVFWCSLGWVVNVVDFIFSALFFFLAAYFSRARKLLIGRIQGKRG